MFYRDLKISLRTFPKYRNDGGNMNISDQNIVNRKREIIDAGLKLVDNGLIARTWGNISCRIDENLFLITPSGKSYLTLTPSDIVAVTIDALKYEGEIKPSSEKGVHAEVYKRFPEINFVIHTHQNYASAMSVTGLSKIIVSSSFPSLSGEIPLAEYALPGTKKLIKNVADVLDKVKGQAVIMSNHGALCFGQNQDSAFNAASELETACLEVLQSKQNEKFPGALSFMSLDSFQLDYIGLAAFFSGKIIHPEKFPVKNKSANLISSEEAIAYSYIEKRLLPYLDDFAQIVGTSCGYVKGQGVVLDKTLPKDIVADLEAIQMIVRKNCLAFYAGVLFDHLKPINKLHSFLMNVVYRKKYSKQI